MRKAFLEGVCPLAETDVVSIMVVGETVIGHEALDEGVYYDLEVILLEEHGVPLKEVG